jgi:chromosome segregation ATPase
MVGIALTVGMMMDKSLIRIIGETKSQKEVMNAISSLNIQVDNLCQFLPQDKVAEFAQVIYYYMTGKIYHSLPN